MVLTPALLFRTMCSVQVQDLNFKPVARYVVAALLLFGANVSMFSQRYEMDEALVTITLVMALVELL